MSGSSRASENFDAQSVQSSIAPDVDQASTPDGIRAGEADRGGNVATLRGEEVTANGETTRRAPAGPSAAEGQMPTAEVPRRVILKHFEMYKTESVRGSQ